MKRLVLFMMAVMLLSITVNAQKKGGKTLVAYFSATGTTARAAKLVAEAVDGTFYEIQPAKKYTAADLDWHDKASRSSVEMSDSKSRPALYSKLGSLAEYDTIYIGFPIWWNLAPRIINTFIESGDFISRTLRSNMQKHFVPIRKNTLFLHIRTLCFSILEQSVHRYELTD